MASPKFPSYDIIFAGGGTSACVAAGRLAAADPSLSILLIERGPNNLNDPTVTNPIFYLTALAPGSKNVIYYPAEKEEKLNNKARMMSTGGMLGGGSSVNALMYTRASAGDYDSFGVEGWGAAELVECGRKLENVEALKPLPNESVHGFDGPVEITHGTHAPKLQHVVDDMCAAAESLGIPHVPDLQDFRCAHGVSKSAKYIGKDGTRQDAAHRYIHPLMADGKHPNLHILTESRVVRVVFEGNRAVGVEFEVEPVFAPEGASSTVKHVKAKRLVVVSAGALGTPLILERSGIGKKDLLESLDIPVVSDLPGVGENLQDHHFLLSAYKTNLKADETMEDFVNGRRDFGATLQEKHSLLAWNGVDVIGKLRPSAEEVTALGPEFEKAWEKDFKNKEDKPLALFGTTGMFMGDRAALAEEMKDEKNGEGMQYMTMATFTSYPYSRGSIHIKSKDCTAAPMLITGFLSDEGGIDVKKVTWAYKKGRDIFRRTNAFAGEVACHHPRFPVGSKAAVSSGPLTSESFGDGDVEGRKVVQQVQYDEDDDRAIEEWVRDNVQSTWHTLGTCKMGEREKGGVVDGSLNVYGTVGLKCCDLSIIPENVAANTNNTALIVGEKAADIMGRELGIAV